MAGTAALLSVIRSLGLFKSPALGLLPIFQAKKHNDLFSSKQGYFSSSPWHAATCGPSGWKTPLCPQCGGNSAEQSSSCTSPCPPMKTSQSDECKVTLIKGVGIGPEVCASVKYLFKAMSIPVAFEEVEVTPVKDNDGVLRLPQQIFDSMQETKVALKGPLITPCPGNTSGGQCCTAALRKAFNLTANVRPLKSVKGSCRTLHDGIDMIVIRENTEGEYCGLEHFVVDGVVQSMKVITDCGSQEIANFAFEYAKKHKRCLVTAVHNANIMHMSEQLFLQYFCEVAKKHSTIPHNSMYMGNLCLDLLCDPTQFDVVVMPNLYGDTLSEMLTGLVGGIGVVPSGNIGSEMAIFECVHGPACDIAGKDMANPTAMILSSVMMLRHMGLTNCAKKLEKAVLQTIESGHCNTRDMGGSATCSDFTKAICERARGMEDEQEEMVCPPLPGKDNHKCPPPPKHGFRKTC